jgi:hypothetical protein
VETAKSSLKSEYEVQGFIRRLVNLIETFATSSSADQIWFFRGLAGMKDVVEHLFGEKSIRY